MGFSRTRLALLGADFLLAGAVLAAASPWLGRFSAKADLLAQFLIQGALATALLLACLVLARRRWRAALATLCLLVQIATLQWPMRAALAAEPGGRALFLNLWVDNQAPQRSLDFIRASGADVVVLAEVIGDWIPALDALADIYPHRVGCLRHPGCDVVLLSRVPVQASRAGRDRASGTPYVEARVRLGGREVTVAGTHLVRPINDGSLWHQLNQARYLAARLGEVEGPKLLLGDLNAVSWGRVVHEIDRLGGMRPVRGSIGGSWPAVLPWPLRIPIDQAIASQDLAQAIRHVGPELGSDHRPITVDLPSPLG